MLGSDAPTGWIEFPNLNTTPEEGTWLPADIRKFREIGSTQLISGGNWVQTASGKQLGCYQKQELSGNPKVYLSTVDSENGIFTTDNAFAINEYAFLTKINVAITVDPVRLQKLTDGTLLLYVVEPGKDAPSGTACYIEVYKSANGNGTDFVKVGEVYRNDQRALYTGTLYGDQNLGQPIQLQNGRILIPFCSQEDYSATYGRAVNCVAYSDNGGVTWTTVKYYHSDYCMGGGSRGIAKFGDRLVTAGTNSYGTGYFEFYYSDNDGTTWTALGIASTNWLYRAIFWGGAIDDVNYMLYSIDNATKDYRLYKSTSSIFPLDIAAYNSGTIGSGNLWEGAYENIGLFGSQGLETIFVNQNTGCIAILGYQGTYGMILNGAQRMLSAYKLQVNNMSVQREDAADSQRLTFSLPNVNPNDPTDFGYFMPYRNTEYGKTQNDWHYAIIPSQKVVAKMGYGDNIATVFTGEIDEVQCGANPRDYNISVDCRDMACWLIDKQVKLVFSGETEYYIEYPLPAGIGETYWLVPGATEIPDIADIVKDLCMRAGFNAADVIVEQTGITLDPMWEKMSYMDCINDLCTAAGYEFFVDEDGKCQFYHQSDRSPNISDASYVLNSTDWTDLGHISIVSGSDVVKDETLVTTYSRTTDYEIDLILGKIRRRIGSTIVDGATVKASFVFAGHVYQEGEDIYGLNLIISRRNMYGTIRVAGDGEEASAVATSPLWDTSRIDLDKVLFADNQYLDTIEKTQKCADRLKADMLNRYICTDFVCVAHPWLQVGDCVQVIESSTTITEIYKIMSISFDLSSDGFSSSIKAFHVGYTPISS